ncbi:type II secretion system minor pseudopilin GspK [Scandinavium sp. H11S7]|uniref:type II secretion system minor pseudopilin GspK n=1 Tax=Scandinavium hiltneri TaxID=2926519 RepID=UPI0021669924|nr:type II secretion system minor pseudopilin GspK [Scandinavium hiltneri]MCS2158435.1 type II secretion system minor pseudopilin GspK [Scandinavium hiltneri]
MTSPRRPKQRGVALLVVLILLVLMSVLAVRISQQFSRNLQKVRYQTSQQQLRWAIHAQVPTIKQLLLDNGAGGDKALAPEGRWQEPVDTRGEHYRVESQIVDAQNCFNVNSLIADEQDAAADSATTPATTTAETEKTTAAATETATTATSAATTPAEPVAAIGSGQDKLAKQQILEKLLEEAGMSSITAENVYTQLLDYLDPDETTEQGGQESDAWNAINARSLPANQVMRTLNELRLLPAFPVNSWAKVSQLLCALPDSTNKVNINTLTAEQAPLLSALFAGVLTKEDAIRLINARPESGWANVDAFETQAEEQFPVKKESLAQGREFIGINSQYFTVNSTGTTDDLTLRVVTQLHLDSATGDIKVWQRRYRMIE